MKDQNYPLAIFTVLILLVLGASACFAQAPDADSLAAVWPAESVSYAKHVNPADSTNWIEIWYNVNGQSRLARYYESGLLTWARTLEQGWIEITPALRSFYDAWSTDPNYATAVQALVTDFSILNFGQ